MNIRTIHTKELRWIDIAEPGSDELQWLENNFKFHERHFLAVRERQHRPHMEQGTGYDFIVLLFPVYNRKTREIVPGEVDFIVSDRFLITIHYRQIHTLDKFFVNCQKETETRNLHLSQGPGLLLYKLLEKLFQRSYPILDHMSEDIENLEAKIFSREDVDILSKIALLRKNIIEFRKMMKTHNYILEQLPRRRADYLSFPQSKNYYRELEESSRNIWDILEALKETAETLQDTTQAIATHRLNQITKMFSIFSAIALPATLVAFLFGIGVEGIPFRHNPYGFWIVAGIMSAVSVSILLIFRHKKWF